MKRLRATLLLAPFLIPLGALARPARAPRLPRADAPIPVPVSTKFLGADGRTYLLSGTLLLTVEAVTPPPTALAISYLTMAPASVTAGQSATVTVQMNQAWPTAVVVALTVADSIVQAPAALTIPALANKGSATVTTAPGVAVEQLVAITAKYGTSGGSANLRVLPAGGPPVPGAAAPQVDGYRLADGSPLVGLPAPGSEVRLVGRGFGALPGRVVWQGAALPVLAWSETLVRVRVPAYSPQGQWEFALFRADAGWCNMQAPRDFRLPPAVGRR